MAKHHTKNTLSTTKWCNTCSAMTPHAVSDGREGHCLTCMDRKAGKEPEQRTSQAVYVQLPCECNAYTFPHFHGGTRERVWA